METEIKKKEQTMMCAEYLKFKDKNMKINNDRPTLNNIKIKSLNNQMVSKRKWNNTNSIGSNNCCTFNISRNNNKFGVWLKWSNKESPRSK